MVSKFLKFLTPGSIERDLLGRHIGPFVFCFFTIMFLLLMQFLIQFMDHLVGKGIPLLVIIELIMVNLAYMVVLAVPMTILASSLIAYGKFSENNEYTAIRAAGVHPMKIIRPVIGATVIMTLFLGWFSNEILPEANYKARALFLDIRMQKPGFDLQENTFYEGIEGYTFLVREMPADSDSLYDVTLFQSPEQGRDRAVIKARKGLLESNERQMSLTLNLFDGTIMRYLQDGRGSSGSLHEETHFGAYRISFDMSDLTFSRTNPEERRRDGRSMSAQAMLAVVDSLRMEKKREIENYKKSLQASFISLREEPDTTVEITEIEAEHHIDNGNIDPGNRQSTAQTDTALPATQPENAGTAHNNERSVNTEEAPLVALRNLNNLEELQTITRMATTHMRETQSMGGDVRNNMRWREERIARFMVEVHKKASIPVACILFGLIGAPLGLLVRKGNMGIHTIISTVLFTYYWISIIQGEKLADRLYISPFLGMWFANMTLAIAGLVLMYQVIYKR